MIFLSAPTEDYRYYVKNYRYEKYGESLWDILRKILKKFTEPIWGLGNRIMLPVHGTIPLVTATFD
jgi:hypothetical protein